jgi:hypothetical protein
VLLIKPWVMVSPKSIQTIRLSIPITMRSLKWIGQGVLNLIDGLTLWCNFSFQSYGTLFIKLYVILRQFFICRTVNWEPLCQFSSNFA